MPTPRVGLISAFVVAACAGGDFTPDLSLVQSWSPELGRLDPFPYPFTAVYEKGSRTLCYAAVSHEQSIDSETLQLIAQIFETREFDVAVLEGFRRSEGVSPDRMIESARRDGSEGFFRGGEVSFSVQQAANKRIPFVGGEPDDSFLLAVVREAGYSTQDLLGYYVVRQIPQWRRSGALERMPFEDLHADFMRGLRQVLNLDEDEIPTLEMMKEWYQARNGTRFRIHTIDSSLSAPLEHGRLFTQRLGAVVSKARDHHKLEVVTSMLNQFDNVLVIYGGSHWSTQRMALEDMLGPPVRTTKDPC